MYLNYNICVRDNSSTGDHAARTREITRHRARTSYGSHANSSLAWIHSVYGNMEFFFA